MAKHSSLKTYVTINQLSFTPSPFFFFLVFFFFSLLFILFLLFCPLDKPSRRKKTHCANSHDNPQHHHDPRGEQRSRMTEGVTDRHDHDARPCHQSDTVTMDDVTSRDLHDGEAHIDRSQQQALGGFVPHKWTILPKTRLSCERSASLTTVSHVI